MRASNPTAAIETTPHPRTCAAAPADATLAPSGDIGQATARTARTDPQSEVAAGRRAELDASGYVVASHAASCLSVGRRRCDDY